MENSSEAEQQAPKVRELKISYHVRYHKYSNAFKAVVPAITISGNWFEKAGFRPLSKIKVEVFEKKLILTSIE